LVSPELVLLLCLNNSIFTGQPGRGSLNQPTHCTAWGPTAAGSLLSAGLTPGWVSEPADKHVLQIEQNKKEKDPGSLPAQSLGC